MTNVVGYVRVSTDEQAESRAGLEAQRAAILAEAERRGWHVVRVIEDAGFSGKDLQRPGIIEALDALKRREADTLVVAKLDRLSRSMLDFAAIMDRATREHWAVVALDLGVDTTTPSGEMMASVLAVFAQFERRLISERTKDALRVRKAQGVRLGRDRVVPNAVVERIRAERARGMRLQAIADGLNADAIPTARGGRRWYVSTIRSVLNQEPAYREERRSRGTGDATVGPLLLPDWVARLGAESCDATPAEWSRWSAFVATYRVTFDAVNPRRNKQEWIDHWPDEYGKVILKPRAAVERSVPEIEVVEAFREAGWAARWTDNFRTAPGWMRPWTQVDNVTRVVTDRVNAIRAEAPKSKSWDVLAWRDDVVMFVECKAEAEQFTDSELAFIWGAQRVGIPLEQFAVVRAAINYPARPSE